MQFRISEKKLMPTVRIPDMFGIRKDAFAKPFFGPMNYDWIERIENDLLNLKKFMGPLTKVNSFVWIPYLIAFSCTPRMFQGFSATIVVFLLVINTSDVINNILNFTAVNFISDFDDVAFEVYQGGKYGPKLKAEADRIELLPVPACINQKYQHVRYRYTVVSIAIALFSLLMLISLIQNSLNHGSPQDLRVQFKDDPLREDLNGCYDCSTRQNRRVLFESYGSNAQQAKSGYCQGNKKFQKPNIVVFCVRRAILFRRSQTFSSKAAACTALFENDALGFVSMF